jgi:hypothetical protein
MLISNSTAQGVFPRISFFLIIKCPTALFAYKQVLFANFGHHISQKLSILEITIRTQLCKPLFSDPRMRAARLAPTHIIFRPLNRAAPAPCTTPDAFYRLPITEYCLPNTEY